MTTGEGSDVDNGAVLQVRLHPDPVGVQSWVVLTGLTELANRDEIILTLRGSAVPVEPGMWMEVRAGGHRMSVHFDGQDQAELVAPRRARLADVVWKRSFRAGEYAPHVVPFGLSLSCVPDNPLPTSSFVRAQLVAALRGRARSRSIVSTFKSLRSRPFLPLSRFESDAREGDGSVLFQVKAWSPEQTRAPDVEEVNEVRAEIIRLARKEFGPRFVGGFVPTPYAVERYPDLLTSAPTNQAGFVNQVHRCSVAVGSSGLYGSNPHKLAEYLAAARPIVTEGLHFETPEQLRAGEHFLEYRDALDCVAAITTLVEDDEQRAAMRAANAQMWRRHVRPDALLRQRLSALSRLHGNDHG